MINVGVLGANGRMGSEVVKAVYSAQGFAFVAALCYHRSSCLSTELVKLSARNAIIQS